MIPYELSYWIKVLWRDSLYLINRFNDPLETSKVSFIILCFKDAIFFRVGFGKAQGWVNNGRIFILGWTVPLTLASKPSFCLRLSDWQVTGYTTALHAAWRRTSRTCSLISMSNTTPWGALLWHHAWCSALPWAWWDGAGDSSCLWSSQPWPLSFSSAC